MKQTSLTISDNSRLADGIFRLVLSGDTSAISAPGQFVDLKLPGFFLRRPISVCDWEPGRLTLIYKVLGRGTEAMTRLAPGAELDVLTGLGNGYDLAPAGDRPLLVGGGVGIPPLYGLAKRLLAAGRTVTAVLGFNRAAEIFLAEEFRALGAEVILTTADGSTGIPGLVTDGMAAAGEYTYLYTCGPEPMLRAVYGACRTAGQFSFEERMGCGFGACMGCTCRTKYGSKRICRDGPVLEKEEIVW
jgi:dihydroorotate dehydrogenase electron transfer subunit